MAHSGNWEFLCKKTWGLSKFAPCSETSKLYLHRLVNCKYSRVQAQLITASSWGIIPAPVKGREEGRCWFSKLTEPEESICKADLDLTWQGEVLSVLGKPTLEAAQGRQLRSWGETCVLGVSPADHRREMAKLDSHDKRTPCWGLFRDRNRVWSTNKDVLQKLIQEMKRVWLREWRDAEIPMKQNSHNLVIDQMCKVRNSCLCYIQTWAQFYTEVSPPLHCNSLHKISLVMFNKSLVKTFSFTPQTSHLNAIKWVRSEKIQCRTRVLEVGPTAGGLAAWEVLQNKKK